MGMIFTAVLIPAKESGFVALNPETGSTTQAKACLKPSQTCRKLQKLYLEEFPLQSAGQPLVTTFEVAASRA